MISTDAAVALYQAIAEANEKRVYEHWHASSISDCPRAHYLKRLGVKPLVTPTAAKMIRWGAGHLLEETLRPHIAKVWGGTTSNIRYTSKKWDLTGEYDNLILDGSTLVEVKSVSDFAFYRGPLTKDTILKQATGGKTKWGKPEYEPMLEPYTHHLLQNHTYVLLLAEQDKEVKNIDFVYVSLSGLLCVYKTEVSEVHLEWVKTRLTNLNKAWEEKKLPPCLCKPESELWGPVYQWCDYRDETNKTCCDESLTKEVVK